MNEILIVRNQNGSVVTKMVKAIATKAELVRRTST